MNQDEICELVDLLKESISTKDWSLVEESLMYMKDYCQECDVSDDESD
jgi:hypothetical protein